MGNSSNLATRVVWAMWLAVGAACGAGAGPGGGGSGGGTAGSLGGGTGAAGAAGGAAGTASGAGGLADVGAGAGGAGTGGAGGAGGASSVATGGTGAALDAADPSGSGGAPADGGGPAGDAGTAGDLMPAEEPSIPDRGATHAAGCPAEEAKPRVLFDIPRAGDTSDDFFRLPFPNDIRMREGHLFLDDFPRPFAFPGFDILDRVVRAIQSEHLGYGPNPVVTFRLTRAAAFEAATGAAAPGAVRFVDLTEGPSFGAAVAHHLGTMAPGIYLCARHLMVLRDSPAPLLPGHTYAVLLTSALVDGDGHSFAADDDFRTMLAHAVPSGLERAAAWQAYAPLRRWLAQDAALAKNTIAAAVFTIDAVDAPAARLRAAVIATDAPVVKDVVRCGPGVVSVCDDSRTKGCSSASAGASFVEYQGRVEIPFFQQGTPPFDSSGGNIAYAADGTPLVARREAVCFSLTVPKGSPGLHGWPLVVYGHGTGGNFRGPVESGLAEQMARGVMDGGAPAPMATLGFDGVLHGPRKGNSTRSTDELVYNVMNPTAARDNGLQAAADLFAFARALPQLASDERPLDLTKIGLYGHSQGGNAAAVAAGYEPTFGAVVLSGTGGGIATSLLEKQKPFAASTWLPLLIGEPVGDPVHPALQMMQLYFDRADPLNHGRHIAAAPMPGSAARHLLHIFGSGDNYAPVDTQLAFAAGAQLPVLHPVLPLAGLRGLTVITAPVRMNFGSGVRRTTALEAQFDPDGYDGHFVSSYNPDAAASILRFLGTYFRDDMPVVE
jgi:dienelactone hydrolase